jgi:hypothetical protein
MIWNKLFGKKKKLTGEELLVKAEDFVQEAKKLVYTDLKSAKKLIEKIYYASIWNKGRSDSDITSVITIGSPLHEEFINVILKCLYMLKVNKRKSAVELQYKDLPSFIVIETSKISKETDILGNLINSLRDTKEELVYIADIDEMKKYDGWVADGKSIKDLNGRSIKDSLLVNTYFIEILYEFAVDPSTVFMSTQPWEQCIRRTFLLSEIPHSKLDIRIKDLVSEVIMEIERFNCEEFENETEINGLPFFRCYRKG